MERRNRIAVEVLSPPLLAGVLFEIYVSMGLLVAGEFEAASLKLLPIVPVMALLLAGLPSLAYALIREVASSRGLDPRSWRAIVASASLGSLSGLLVEVIRMRRLERLKDAPFFLALGLIVGWMIGMLVRRWSMSSEAQRPRRT